MSFNLNDREQKILEVADKFVPKTNLILFATLAGSIGGVLMIISGLMEISSREGIKTISTGLLLLGFFVTFYASQKAMAEMYGVIRKLKADLKK